MSYPFQGGANNHPYPPTMNYPTAPPLHNASVPAYPPQPGQAGYYPSPYPNSAPYPPSTVPGSSPYPTLPSTTPISTPYPASNAVPYPIGQPNPYPSSTPYPIGPSNPLPSYSPYPPPAGQLPHPSQGHPGHPPHHSSGMSHHGGSFHHQHGSPAQPAFNKGSPTVKPAHPFNPQADAEVLRKAMKGFGTDEAAIIAVLSKRTNAQRLEISAQFKTLYGKDLIKDLKSELGGKLEQLILAMMTPIHEYYAQEVRHAISGLGTKESTIIEVLCTLSNAELYAVKTTYEKLYKKPMESDLRGDTSGAFKRLLTSLSQCKRDESNVVDPAAAEADAKALHLAGEKKMGTDESTFNAILCSRNYAQLNAIFSAYQRLTGHGFEKAVKGEFSGDIEDGLLAIVECVQNRQGYLAKCLHKSMSGAGTNDRALIRLIVTRSEIDLEEIKKQFAAKYGKTLESFIKGDTSGDYRKLLIALQE